MQTQMETFTYICAFLFKENTLLTCSALLASFISSILSFDLKILQRGPNFSTHI